MSSSKEHREEGTMCNSKASVGHWSLFLGVVLLALVAVSPTAWTIPAKPDAGQEPTGVAPILYNLTPTEGAIVSQDELSRAAATIETRRQVSVSWAGIFVDDQRRPAELMGPTYYQHTVSADLGYLSPGKHTVRVKVVDSEGQVGGYVWEFTVV
jgi:hypothetical protein